MAKDTRRDYIFVNELLLPAVNGFQVDVSDRFPTHQPLQLRLTLGNLVIEAYRCKKTSSAAQAVQLKLDKCISDSPDSKPGDVAKAQKAILHQHMDDALHDRETRMQAAAARRDTTAIWCLITACAEQGFVNYLELTGKTKLAMMGGAKVEIRRCTSHAMPPRDSPARGEAKTAHRAADHLITQARRCGHMAARTTKTRCDRDQLRAKERRHRAKPQYSYRF